MPQNVTVWALIRLDCCPYKKRGFGHRWQVTKAIEDTLGRWSSASQAERFPKKPDLPTP